MASELDYLPQLRSCSGHESHEKGRANWK